MPTVTATGLQPDGAKRNIQFVLNDDDAIHRHLGVVGSGLHRATRLVHVAAGAQKHNPFVTKSRIGGISVRAAMFLETYTEPTGQLIDNEVPDVMPSGGVFLTGIPQPNDEPDRQEP